MPPKFSVVIPAYNQGKFLFQAVQSVLDQTVQDFEVLVVNDASTDDSASVMAQFHDPRVICLTHPQNRRLPAARNTGISASSGEWIALLDADDFFHPRKLEAHLRFFELHPDVSITYNSRFELHHSSLKIRDIYQPPATAHLKDFVLGYPFAPSDMVIHQDAIAQVGLFDESYHFFGEDFEYYARLALAGFRFARVDGVLNYRRYHAGRKNTHLEDLIQFNTRTLDSIFADPRCPADVMALRKTAYANYYTEVACVALTQGDTELGLKFLREILRIDPGAASEKPYKLIHALFTNVIIDESVDHEKLLNTIFEQLPAAVTRTAEQKAQLISRGYLIKGTQSAMWGDENAAGAYLRKAAGAGAVIDVSYRGMVASQLAVIQAEMGKEAATNSARQLFAHLKAFGGDSCVRKIWGLFFINQAFTSYRSGNYTQVLREVAQTVSNDPTFLTNKGLLSITARAGWKTMINKVFKNRPSPDEETSADDRSPIS